VDLEVEYNELSDKLEETIRKLPSRQRDVYELHKKKGLKYSEIAEKLEVSVNTVENHMSRALKALRKQLTDYTLLSLLFWQLFV
jgi:RNA polymerase sigma-70 factor (ECF subfamily)